MRLVLLSDITCHLNSLNLQLQGKDKQPGSKLRAVTAFQNIITELFIPYRQFVHFSTLRTATSNDPQLLHHFSYDEFKTILEESREELESRFKDIRKYKDFF